MKKLITIMLFITLLSSCMYTSFKPTYWKIVDINKLENYCTYEIETFGFNTYFLDSCNKYDIGDTIKLTKW